MVLRKTLAWSCSAVLVGSLTVPATSAQEVEVQAGDTAVQVDRNGAQLQTRPNQPATEPNRQRPNRQPLRPGANMDRQIAQWLIVDQQNIINLAQYGLQKSQTPQVRELAETIIREHETFASKLRDGSGEGATTARPIDSEDTTRGDQREERREATREARRDEVRDQDGQRRPIENLGDRLEDGVERLTDRAERVAGEARQGLDRAVDGDRPTRGARWVDIHREIGQKVEEVVRQDLDQREGYEFEAAFVGMLVASHLQQEATLAVLSTRVSGDLAQTLEQAQASVKQHRAQAEQVMGQLGKENAR